MSHLIAPSVLACNFANIQQEIEMLNASEADWVHVDVMDGMFVPNISFGMPVIQAMKKHSTKPLDVHLMIEKPERYISEFKNVGADILTVHYEACNHLHRVLQMIRSEGMMAGVALNPHTPVELLEPVLEEIDLVCLMSVNPGFGGQSFIDKTYDKISKLQNMIKAKGISVKIEIDGGVKHNNAKKLLDTGADVLVAGSFVFNSENPEETISALKAL